MAVGTFDTPTHCSTNVYVACVCGCIHVCACECIVYVDAYICVCVCVCVCGCLHVCTCECVCGGGVMHVWVLFYASNSPLSAHTNLGMYSVHAFHLVGSFACFSVGGKPLRSFLAIPQA